MIFTACKPRNNQVGRANNETTTSNTESGSESDSEVKSSENIRSVRVVVARAGDLTATRNVSVTIEPSQDSRVASGASGQVKSVLKREGSKVNADEVVIKLDDDTLQIQKRNAELALQSAQINLNKARLSNNENNQQLLVESQSVKSNLAVAKKQYEEGQALFEVGGIAQVDLLALEAQYQKSQAASVQIQDSLARLQRAESEDIALLGVQVKQARAQLEQANQALADAQIIAPFTGEVAEVFVEEGEFVVVGGAVFRLISTEKQLGRFSVPPQDAAHLTKQKEVIFNYSGSEYLAEIVRSSTVTSGQRLVDIVAELKVNEPAIPASSIAQLNYEVKLASGLLVPAAAITFEGGKRYLFVVKDGFAKRTEVTIVAEASARAAVEGIVEETEVIYPLPLDLRNNAKVNVLNLQ